jgi:NADH-quinone oxidoreductase subunit L
MTGVLVVLAGLSAVGGFVGIVHYLEPSLPLPPVQPGLEHAEPAVVFASVALAVAGLLGAAYCFGGNARRADRLRARFAGWYGVLAHKYYVDEAYEALLERPLLWVSQRVFLDVGDRRLLDGSLDGLATLARRSAGALARVQAGNLQLYALLALAGLVATLAWTWRHG